MRQFGGEFLRTPKHLATRSGLKQSVGFDMARIAGENHSSLGLTLALLKSMKKGLCLITLKSRVSGRISRGLSLWISIGVSLLSLTASAHVISATDVGGGVEQGAVTHVLQLDHSPEIVQVQMRIDRGDYIDVETFWIYFDSPDRAREFQALLQKQSDLVLSFNLKKAFRTNHLNNTANPRLVKKEIYSFAHFEMRDVQVGSLQVSQQEALTALLGVPQPQAPSRTHEVLRTEGNFEQKVSEKNFEFQPEDSFEEPSTVSSTAPGEGTGEPTRPLSDEDEGEDEVNPFDIVPPPTGSEEPGDALDSADNTVGDSNDSDWIDTFDSELDSD